MDTRLDSYVYQHKKADTKEIFYVGKGVKSRAYVKNKRSDEWKTIVNQHGVIIEILISNIDNEFANLIEIETIDSYKKQGYLLVNKTNGGSGILGFKLSENHRLSIVNRMQGNKFCVNRLMSNQTKEKISKANVGKKHTLEAKEKISKSLLGNTYTLGYKHTAEAKQKQRIASMTNPKCIQTQYKCTTVYVKDGVKYYGSFEASNKTQVPRTTLMRYAKANKNGWSVNFIDGKQ